MRKKDYILARVGKRLDFDHKAPFDPIIDDLNDILDIGDDEDNEDD